MIVCVPAVIKVAEKVCAVGARESVLSREHEAPRGARIGRGEVDRAGVGNRRAAGIFGGDGEVEGLPATTLDGAEMTN